MTADSPNGTGARRGQRARCPICNQPPTPRFRPFCSARCADIDLGRWFQGNYAIATDEGPEDGGADKNHEPPAGGPEDGSRS